MQLKLQQICSTPTKFFDELLYLQHTFLSFHVIEFLKPLYSGWSFSEPSSMFVCQLQYTQVATQTTTEGLKQPLIFTLSLVHAAIKLSFT